VKKQGQILLKYRIDPKQGSRVCNNFSRLAHQWGRFRHTNKDVNRPFDWRSIVSNLNHFQNSHSCVKYLRARNDSNGSVNVGELRYTKKDRN